MYQAEADEKGTGDGESIVVKVSMLLNAICVCMRLANILDKTPYIAQSRNTTAGHT